MNRGSFLSRFRFNKVLRLVEDDNYTSTLKTLPLPTIVVVGDENAGKSSTLERIAMLNVFPRTNKICTRQPIALKLRHAGNISHRRPAIRLRIPGSQERIGLTEDQASEAISCHMAKLAAEGKGVVFGEEIEVEVQSDGVPSMDLIDLPGLIAVRTNDVSEPDNIAEMTEQCTRHYLKKKETGAVVCVLDATMDNLRTSKALRLVQDVRPDLRRFTIGVLAKADKAFDISWQDEGRNSPFWKLKERLRGDAEDYVPIHGGYYALKNRNTMTNTEVSLAMQSIDEEDWFNETFGEDESIRPRLGIKALLEQIDWMVCQYLNKTYVPARLGELQQEKVKCVDQLHKLGTAPSELPISALFEHTETRLKFALRPDVADSLCDSLISDMPPIEILGSTRYERVVSTRKLVEQYKQSLKNEIPVRLLAGRVANAVRECFDSDVEGDCRLCRFSEFRETLVKVVENQIIARAKRFRNSVLIRLRTIVQVSPGPALDVEKVRDCVADCAIATLIVPVAEMDCAKQLQGVVNSMPKEDCASERADLEVNLTRIEESIAALKEMQNV